MLAQTALPLASQFPLAAYSYAAELTETTRVSVTAEVLTSDIKADQFLYFGSAVFNLALLLYVLACSFSP